MNVFLILAGLTISAIVIIAIYSVLRSKKQTGKLAETTFERIKPLYEKLERGEQLSTEDISPYATKVSTRQLTFQLLREHNKTDLFPEELYTLEKGAESNLANWLEFPTELNACPDEIEHVKRVTFDIDGSSNLAHYEVFKYKVYEPHWAAKNGWMLGVVGPYFADSKPYDFPHATFSRINSTIDAITPDEEAKWAHENIANRRYMKYGLE